MMTTNNSNRLFVVAGWCAYASAVVSIVGIVFWVIMYIGFFTSNKQLQNFGPLNDICVIIQYFLALASTLALYHLLKAHVPVLSRAAMWIGIVGIFVIVILKFLVVAGVMTFEDEIGPAFIGLLLVGAWQVITGYLGRATGKLPHGLLMSVLALTYLGFPIWAVWLGRLLLSGKVTLPGHSPSLRGELA